MTEIKKSTSGSIDFFLKIFVFFKEVQEIGVITIENGKFKFTVRFLLKVANKKRRSEGSKYN